MVWRTALQHLPYLQPGIISKLSGVGIPSDPVPHLGNYANLLHGGPPYVISFYPSSHVITPGSSLDLWWEVDGAESITITPVELHGIPNELPSLVGALDPHKGHYHFPNINGTRSWVGAFELQATNRCNAESSPVSTWITIQMNVGLAIALGGGGAKGDFEVGVLKYLYEQGIRAEIVTGTSVGAINAVKLGEGDDVGGRSALDRLEAIWRGLIVNNDMYLPQPWIGDLANNSLIKFFVEDMMQKVSDITSNLMKDALFPPLLIFDLVTLINDGEDLNNAISRMENAPSVYRLDPIEVDSVIMPIWTRNRVAASGIVVRLGTASLNTGEMLYVTENGVLTRSDGRTYVAEVDLVDGVLASAAMPIAFPPRQLGPYLCTDGGVR